MKKNLVLLLMLTCCSTAIFAQSIKFGDLLTLSTLNNDGAYQFVARSNAFRQDYTQDVDGYQMEYFKKIGAKPDFERIAVGRYSKLYNGTILRTLDYSSTDVQNLLNLVSQAKEYGLQLQFRGADDLNNIYLFSNSLFSVNFYIRRDQTSGTLEIKQKDYVQVD
jgi:hypothetical protein